MLKVKVKIYCILLEVDPQIQETSQQLRALPHDTLLFSSHLAGALDSFFPSLQQRAL